MVKKLTFLLVTIPIACSLGLAGEYYVPDRNVVAGAEHYSCVDPLLDESGDVIGFAFCDPVNSQLILSRYYGTDVLTYEFDIPPQQAIHRYSADFDTLFVYVASWDNLWDLRREMTLLTITESSSARQTVVPAIYSYLGTPEIVRNELRFVGPPEQPTGVLYELTVDYVFNLLGQGVERNRRSTAIVYTPDLSNELTKKRASSYCEVGEDIDGQPVQVWFDNQFYGWDFSEYSGAVDTGSEASALLTVATPVGEELLQRQSWDANLTGLLAAELSSAHAGTELITAGQAEDVLGRSITSAPHVAAYSISRDSIVELWYTEFETDNVELAAFAPHSRALAVEANGTLYVLSPATGAVIDSFLLDRQLRAPKVFESDYVGAGLNLVGFALDTVITYRLELSRERGSRTSQEDEPEVPATFELVQNYPNPFNGATQIQYSNEAIQHLTLTIFNVLGQEVKVLYEAITSPGDYSVEWNGTDNFGDPQPSGIYFAELRSGSQSQIIKLIYLK
jgi:hypothetical protein